MFSFPWWLSLLVGFLSLSQEILWVRVLGFAYETVPPAFSFVLATYLLGIALGAALGKRLCAARWNLYAIAATVLCAAGMLDAATPPLIAGCVHPSDALWLAPGGLIVAAAALKSTLFPIVHHLGSDASGSRLARSVSRIYFGNILGSAAGPLLTGFVALDRLSVDTCFELSGAACVVAAACCTIRIRAWRTLGLTAAAAVAVLALALAHGSSRPSVLEALAVHRGASVGHFIANRHGVIHTSTVTRDDGPALDFVYGGNVYDGIASVDVDVNLNRLDRLYLLALLQPRPARVLVIGMSTGAWSRALLGFPGVKSVDVVEINPGYVDVLGDYPDLAPLLRDPRLHLYIDDGRRWLKRNPAARYDLIVQNTTYHWRANATNLLSREYFAEVRRHLEPGGVVTVNTTGSFDVLATGAAAFPYAYRYANFMYVSDRPLVPVSGRLGAVLRPDGRTFASASGTTSAPYSVAAFLSSARLDPVREFIARRHASAQIISDDNLLPEYRHGRRMGPEWLGVFLPPPEETFF